MNDPIPVSIQRFILTSIDSVSHLEAILLLRNSAAEWNAVEIAQRLFISEKSASEILSDLCTAGFASKKNHNTFQYEPVSPQLREMMEELNRLYPRHLVVISKLIHTKTDRQAQSFGDAFKWRQE